MKTTILLICGLFLIGDIATPSTVLAAKDKPAIVAEKKEDLDKLLQHYWAIEQSLSQDTLVGVKEAAELMIPAARALKNQDLSKQVQKTSEALAGSAGEASGHSSIEKTREDFKRLSRLLAGYLKSNPQSEWSVFHCPMKKAEWVQKSGTEVQNPFYGKEMATCGTQVK